MEFEQAQLGSLYIPKRPNGPFNTLESTPIPDTFCVNPPVLTPEQVQSVFEHLSEGQPDRLVALREVQAANKDILDKSQRVIGVILDARGVDKQQKPPKVAPDGWAGDTINASMLLNVLQDAHKDVQVISNQPDLFVGNAANGIQLPQGDAVWPFGYIPKYAEKRPGFIEFLYQHQGPESVFVAPINANLPWFFRLEERDGRIGFTKESLETFLKLQFATTGVRDGNFIGIQQGVWAKLCHHTQAYQVLAELLGVSTKDWTQFPPPSIHPSSAALAAGRQQAAGLSPTLNLILHIGSNLNVPLKNDKVYSPDKWRQILEAVRDGKLDPGNIIFFQPLRPDQARDTNTVADFAEGLFPGRVRRMPQERLSGLGHLAALMDNVRDTAVFASLDSGVGHLASARRLSQVVVSGPYPMEFYGPRRALVVKPHDGSKRANDVNPEYVAQAILHQSRQVLRRA